MQADFQHLLDRARSNQYAETLPVLAFYWLKTVYGSGYVRGEWKALDGFLRETLAGSDAGDAHWRQTLNDLQGWARYAALRARQSAPSSPDRAPEPARTTLSPETLVPYVARLLNEWLPVEVARLLIAEAEGGSAQEGGIPVLSAARALERLLLREGLSPGTLEALLQPGLMSPRLVYPADMEILRHVALFLLGRTGAPTPGVLPATLLSVAPDAPLSRDYGEAVGRAVLAARAGREELRVPIAPDQASRVLEHDHVRFTSVVVTMDGRWWQADKLQGGDQDMVLYRPMGRLHIDYSGDHARVKVPCLETRRRWPGPVSIADTVELFGRQWHASRWEQDATGAWLQLVFDRTLPLDKVAPRAEDTLRRSRPASVDMAWAALESALAAAFAWNSRDPIEQLRHDELVPVGRALFALMEAVMTYRLRKLETIETRLRAVRYLGAGLVDTYGLVPWRILPEPVRRVLLAGRWYRVLADLLHEVFEGLPDRRGEAARQDSALRRLLHRRSAESSPSPPSRAA